MTHVKFNNRGRSFDNVVDELFNGLPVLFNEGYNTLTKQGFVPVNIKDVVLDIQSMSLHQVLKKLISK